MRAERCGKLELKVGVPPAQFVAGGGQVSPQMNAGGQEVGNHQHATCAPLHTSFAAAANVGFGQLEKAGFDDGVASQRCKARRQLTEIGIGGRFPAAVGDQEDGG